jgi:hypothetical protein
MPPTAATLRQLRVDQPFADRPLGEVADREQNAGAVAQLSVRAPSVGRATEPARNVNIRISSSSGSPIPTASENVPSPGAGNA